MAYIISGIQQMGIGNNNVHATWAWYRRFFGIDIPVFEEAATAALMLPYTGNAPQARHAILALHRQGGGGLEIWQYTQRTPEFCGFDIKIGDLGIFAAKFPCKNADAFYAELKQKNALMLTPVGKNPAGQRHFFMTDLHGNTINVVEEPNRQWFTDKNLPNGGVSGAILGVSNIEKSLALYTDILGYDTVIYDKTGFFDDLQGVNGSENTVRRVLLRHSKPRQGAFSRMFGATEIELVQMIDATPRKIFENRYWGDCGYIHLCFDVADMPALSSFCAKKGFAFTIDSSTVHATGFDMGEAAGNFSYIEDPDGTLIEFVETHKVPILKKIGWYIHLKNRNPAKPLPDFMLRAMALNRKKD